MGWIPLYIRYIQTYFRSEAQGFRKISDKRFISGNDPDNETKEFKMKKASSKKVAPKKEKVVKSLSSKVDLFVEFKDLPELEKLLTNNPKTRDKVMDIMIGAFTDQKDQRCLVGLYQTLNEGLSDKIVQKSILAASKLEMKSKIRTCYIDLKGEKVSVKDVYRIACGYLGIEISNKDFTTWDAINELKFFVAINWMPNGKDETHVQHDLTIIENV
jgi:hypothetical protein